MKSIIFALVAVASIAASAQQDLSGCKVSADGKTAKCFVENLGEGGNQSGYITIKVRSGSTPTADLGCPVGEAGYAPCKEGKVPKWLKDLSQAFLDAGFTTPEDNHDMSPGGGN